MRTLILLILISTVAFAQQKGTFTDPRDKKKYKTVKIGELTWMAENLNFEAEGSKCYQDAPANCKKYGRIYEWRAAMTACPEGWHLPSDSAWDALTTSVGGTGTGGRTGAAPKLKAASGFAALPGGYGDTYYNFTHIGNFGYWWSSKSMGQIIGTGRNINYQSGANGNVGLGFGNKTHLYSVRCLQGSREAAEAIIEKVLAAAEEKERVAKEKAEKEAKEKAEKDMAAAKAKIAANSSTFTDSRDGKTYKAVKIDKLTWMAENLSFVAEGSKCYEDKEENCQKYGRLYDFETATKACPTGWFLPTNVEWDALSQTVGSDARKLMSTSGWVDSKGNPANGEDWFGFTLLPGGVWGSQLKNFNGAGTVTVFWGVRGSIPLMVMLSGTFIKQDLARMKLDLYSVRCVKK